MPATYATHRTVTGETNPWAHWRFDWTRNLCITENGPQPAFGQLSSPCRTTTVSNMSILPSRMVKILLS